MLELFTGGFSHLQHTSVIGSLVIIILISMSIMTWSVLIIKWFEVRKMELSSKIFIKRFWDSRSLNDLNKDIDTLPYSPAREIFKDSYQELVRGSQLKESAISVELAISAALDNLTRTMHRSKVEERKKQERLIWLLAISASVSPFIGLFGTVWGIMDAFQKIALNEGSSLAVVAPGISEALVATAFGLAAAIPAVVGYNLLHHMIRIMFSRIDGFGSDFMNIVERYLVSHSNHKGSSPGMGV